MRCLYRLTIIAACSMFVDNEIKERWAWRMKMKLRCWAYVDVDVAVELKKIEILKVVNKYAAWS